MGEAVGDRGGVARVGRGSAEDGSGGEQAVSLWRLTDGGAVFMQRAPVASASPSPLNEQRADER